MIISNSYHSRFPAVLTEVSDIEGSMFKTSSKPSSNFVSPPWTPSSAMAVWVFIFISILFLYFPFKQVVSGEVCQQSSWQANSLGLFIIFVFLHFILFARIFYDFSKPRRRAIIEWVGVRFQDLCEFFLWGHAIGHTDNIRAKARGKVTKVD